MRRPLSLTLLSVAIAAMAACSRSPSASFCRVECVLLFELRDPSQASTLGREAIELMHAPVQRLLTGPQIPRTDVGDPAATGPRFDAGISAGFLTHADYQAFLRHPATLRFMQRWQARSLSIHTAAFGPTCEPESREAAPQP